MRKLQYKLADGTVVNTYKEAQASGQRFEDFLTTIKEPVRISKKRKELLEVLLYI